MTHDPVQIIRDLLVYPAPNQHILDAIKRAHEFLAHIDANAPGVAVRVKLPDGTEGYLTGKTGPNWITGNRADAYLGHTLEQAREQAQIMTNNRRRTRVYAAEGDPFPEIAAPATVPPSACDTSKIDFTLKRGDTVYSPTWSDGEKSLEVIDVNWALRAVAVRLAPNGGIVIWPATAVTRTKGTTQE